MNEIEGVINNTTRWINGLYEEKACMSKWYELIRKFVWRNLNLQETDLVWANFNLHGNSMGRIRWDGMMWVRERARELVFLYDKTLICMRKRIGMRRMSKISNDGIAYDVVEWGKKRVWRKTSLHGKTLIWCGPFFYCGPCFSYGCDNYGGWRLYEHQDFYFIQNLILRWLSYEIWYCDDFRMEFGTTIIFIWNLVLR